MRRAMLMGIATAAICVLAGFSTTGSSDAAHDFIKIREAYTRTPNLAMDVIYKAYQGHHSDVLVGNHSGRYIKAGEDNLYMKLYGTVTIRNKDIVMVKDDSTKAVLVKAADPEDGKLPAMDMDKLLQLCKQVEDLPIQGSVKGYRLSFGDQTTDMNAVEIYFDTHTCFVQKVVLYYARDQDVYTEKRSLARKETYKPRLEVLYEHINTSPVPSELMFSVNTYIKKVKNTWTLQPALKGYQLVDQTLTQSTKP